MLKILEVRTNTLIQCSVVLTTYQPRAKSESENLRLRPCRIDRAVEQYGNVENLDFLVKIERSRLTNCFLYGFLNFLDGYVGNAIVPWAIRENNALESSNQSACYSGYERKSYNNSLF